MIIDLMGKTAKRADVLTNYKFEYTWSTGWKETCTIEKRNDGSYIMETQTTHYPGGDLVPNPRYHYCVFKGLKDISLLDNFIFNPKFKEIKLFKCGCEI